MDSGMKDKPAFGSPCNNCGRCCTQSACGLAQRALRAPFHGPCPALILGPDGSQCGLVVHPERYAPDRAALVGKERLGAASAIIIGAGHGCDMVDPDGIDDGRFAPGFHQVRAAVAAYQLWGLFM